jgi:predicted nucleic acid-binding protein
MRASVADASALACIVFGEAEAPTVVEKLGRARLLAPALVTYELASVCLKKIRRAPKERAAYLAGLELAGCMQVELVEVPATAAIEIAEATSLTVYDASYLYVARQFGAELVTLDRKLARAAAAG